MRIRGISKIREEMSDVSIIKGWDMDNETLIKLLGSALMDRDEARDEAERIKKKAKKKKRRRRSRSPLPEKLTAASPTKTIRSTKRRRIWRSRLFLRSSRCASKTRIFGGDNTIHLLDFFGKFIRQTRPPPRAPVIS